MLWWFPSVIVQLQRGDYAEEILLLPMSCLLVAGIFRNNLTRKGRKMGVLISPSGEVVSWMSLPIKSASAVEELGKFCDRGNGRGEGSR